MDINPLLDDYDGLADAIVCVLNEERAALRCQNKTPDEALLERKSELIGRLGSVLERLRSAREGPGDAAFYTRERMDRVQHKLTKILQLDREIEKLFLSRAVKPVMPQMMPPARMVGNAYRAAAGFR